MDHYTKKIVIDKTRARCDCLHIPFNIPKLIPDMATAETPVCDISYDDSEAINSVFDEEI